MEAQRQLCKTSEGDERKSYEQEESKVRLVILDLNSCIKFFAKLSAMCFATSYKARLCDGL